ncbi:hypothetical protein GGR54DRAFT_610361 [Hypoxylon sp. NC1633]|nr:hypothetical protein GGR54DRAFT_610361 [Hypoxylon sp. NC1633]
MGIEVKLEKKTYNTRDSLVVTDPTTSLAVSGLSMGEQTGSRILQILWSYVTSSCVASSYKPCQPRSTHHIHRFTVHACRSQPAIARQAYITESTDGPGWENVPEGF